MNSLTGFVSLVIGIAQDSFVSKAVLLLKKNYVLFYFYIKSYLSLLD